MRMFHRLLAYVVAAFLAFMAGQKFLGDAPLFTIIEANAQTMWGMDLPWIEPWGRYAVGVLEALAAALLVLERRYVGACLSAFIFAGAVGAHLTLLGVETPMTSEIGAATSPVLFLMAMTGLAVSLWLIWLARPRNTFAG